MAVVNLKFLEGVSEDFAKEDSCRLEIAADGDDSPLTLRRDLGTGERWHLERRIPFDDEVRIKLWDEDFPDPDDFLGEVVIEPEPHLRAVGVFDEDSNLITGHLAGIYHLWYEVLEPASDPQSFFRPHTLHVRRLLSRSGRGVLAEEQHRKVVGAPLYSASEVVSLRDHMRRHAEQDGGRSGTGSLRTWLLEHCIPWGDRTLLPVDETPEAFNPGDVLSGAEPNWLPVSGERSRRQSGTCLDSRLSHGDNPERHASLDWLVDVALDPAYTYMLNETSKGTDLDGRTAYPISHNEWEAASMPLPFRPFPGEHVTFVGRHIFDVGHPPVHTEIHPYHTVVRRHTTAAPIGDSGAMVPVNRAVVGMSACGGFPGDTDGRWREETGAAPPAWVTDEVRPCWFTDLRRHPLTFRLLPPVRRPSTDAVLTSRIVLCEVIQVDDGDGLRGFLERCRKNEPAQGGGELGFRLWNREHGLPHGFPPERASGALAPRITARDGRWLDVRVDLRSAPRIPVGYYAIVECGWSEPGHHTIQEYDVTFESVKAVEIDDLFADDWHLFFGVNGQWDARWLADAVGEGDTVSPERTFRVRTVDGMPLALRDCGIESEGTVAWNQKLDRVELTATGRRHLQALDNHDHTHVLSRGDDSLRFQARGWEIQPGDTRHQWTISVTRRAVF